MHVLPQLTVRDALQLSTAVTEPHLPAQNVASPAYVQLQTLEVQDCGDAHVPQLTVRLLPQLSLALTLLQLAPLREQNRASLSAVQPQVLAVPLPPQVWPVPLQLLDPQSTVRFRPQLSVADTLPHLPAQKAVSVCGVHVWPQTLAVTAPQVCGGAQVPQTTVRLTPQLSAALKL
jgi:hypothetical protein